MVCVNCKKEFDVSKDVQPGQPVTCPACGAVMAKNSAAKVGSIMDRVADALDNASDDVTGMKHPLFVRTMIEVVITILQAIAKRLQS